MDIEKIKRVALGVASDEEKQEVAAWIAGEEGRQRFLDDARRFYRSEWPEDKEIDRRVEEMQWKVLGHRRKKRTVYLRWISVAACAAAVVGVFFFTNLPEKEGTDMKSWGTTEQIAAVELVLPDGSRHELTDKETTVQEIVAAKETGEYLVPRGQLLVEKLSAVPAVEYNEIIVPRGKEYTLTLADGSTVILNAETRIKFPNTFTGNERKIFLSGEAYFNIVRNEAHPFIVEFAEGAVRVLGTQFNVKAYQGQHTSATLVSGKVEIVSDGERALLQPGQLCEILPEGLAVSEADLMSVLAWKNNEFVFKEASWQQVMNELERYYDAEIVYNAPEMEGMKLHIYMERPGTLAEALEVIARIADISYRIEGKKAIIKKQ